MLSKQKWQYPTEPYLEEKKYKILEISHIISHLESSIVCPRGLITPPVARTLNYE